jgi:hypothetical protein
MSKENTPSIYKSLAAFQQECPTIHKDTQGYGYTYATLPAIFEVINPILGKYQLGFTQLIEGESIKSILFHTETGEKLESVTNIPQGVSLKGMNDYQVLGSAITYLRRYALSAMLGVVTDKDTDAGGEQKKTPKPQPKKLLPLVQGTQNWDKVVTYLAEGGNLPEVKKKYTITPENETELLKEVTDKA